MTIRVYKGGWKPPLLLPLPAMKPVGGLSWYQFGATNPDTYFSINTNGSDGTALPGNTGWDRQNLGIPIHPYPQSLMRRCVLQNNGEKVAYYLDCDDSTKKAGKWLRVHEGSFDPISGVPNIAAGQKNGSAALRENIPAWDASQFYVPGNRVIHNSLLWEALEESTGAAPASGTENAVLTGTDGQVMVEIPRFYTDIDFDEGANRHSWDIVTDPKEVVPYPNLLSDGQHLPTEKVINGRTYEVHPAFQKAGVERSHRYIGAYRARATNTSNNASGELQSISGGSYIASITRPNFRAKARNRNAGLNDPSGNANNVWHLLDWDLWYALQLLYLTEYRTFYSQAVLGYGNVTGSTYAKTCGRANKLGNASGAYNSSGNLVAVSATTASDGLAFRGIEDFYGSMYVFIDGWNINNRVHYRSSTPSQFADDTATNYQAIMGGASAATSSGYVRQTGERFTATGVGGTDTTYLTDYYYQSTGWTVAAVGGNAGNGAVDGAFIVGAAYASYYAHTVVGGVLAR